jgi:hypothetical protein
MRFRYLTILLVVGGIIGWYQIASRGASALGGLVRISECQHNFGAVLQGTQVSHTFYVRNSSSGRLHIVRAGSSGLGTVSVSKEWLEAGETTSLRVSCDTAELKVGALRLQSLVYFENVAVPLVVTLKGKIAKTFPSAINAGNILRGKKQTLIYEIFPIGKQPLRLIKATYPKHITSVGVKTHGRALRVHVRLAPDVPYGDFTYPLTIATNDRFQPGKKTLVKGHVMERIVCQPDHVSLGVFRSPKDVHRTINFVSPYGHRFSIKEATCNLPQISLKPQSDRPDSSQAIIIQMKDTAPGPVEGQVEIITASPDMSLKIPIYGLYLVEHKKGGKAHE